MIIIALLIASLIAIFIGYSFLKVKETAYSEPFSLATRFNYRINIPEPGTYHVELTTTNPEDTIYLADKYYGPGTPDKFGNVVKPERESTHASGEYSFEGMTTCIIDGADRYRNVDTTLTYPEDSTDIRITTSQLYNPVSKGEYTLNITKIE
jgi:hypothetical protein